MIRFWNDKQLAMDLKSAALSEKDKVTYLVAGILLAAFLALFSTAFASYAHALHHPSIHSDATANVPAGSYADHPSSAPSTGNAPFIYTNPFFRIVSYGYLVAVICILYRVNQQGDGMHMIERYVCLNFPVIIRTLIFVFIFAFIIGFVIGFLAGVFPEFLPVDYKKYLNLFIMLGSILYPALYYYLRMKTLFKIASGQMEP